jgi:uncharacterized membrane protein (UPF0127 family)
MIYAIKKISRLICIVALLASGCAIPPAHKNTAPGHTLTPIRKIAVDGTAISVHIATSPAEQQRGLSGIPSIQKNEGMLFQYAQATRPTFWMKGMLFPIDIIWIQDRRVIGINHNLQPPDAEYPNDMLARYTAPGDVTAVLETQAGWAATHTIHTGSIVTELPH